MGTNQENRAFEEEVRRTADTLFQLVAGECKPELFVRGSQQVEIDGVARTRDLTHLIMVTTSTRLEKVREDVRKLQIAADSESGNGNSTKKWMIVEQNPEAPHVKHARENNVLILTLRQMRARFFDGLDYLSKRETCSFGSARDPNTGSFIVKTDEFIEAPMTNIESDCSITLQEIVDKISQGESVVIVGSFGSGKSLTLRQIWMSLVGKYRKEKFDKVPTALNLREHWGAQYGDEILRRHSKSIGFGDKEDLIIAWHANMLSLLVDGFDEMASPGVVEINNYFVLRKIRQDSLASVRDLTLKTPLGMGMLFTGREHYFDNREELEHSLGLQNRRFTRVRIEEFDEAKAEEYLLRKGITVDIPDWLPRKPLLLGYLTRRGLLREVLEIDSTSGQSKAWYEFIKLICRREAEHERSAMDAETVQQVLEDLAIQVRSTSSGVGPITALMLSQAYINVTGQIPADAVVMQLQRLPGLTERDAEPGSRSFVEKDFLDSLQGLAIARLIGKGVIGNGGLHSPSTVRVNDKGWFESLGALGAGVAAVSLKNDGWKITDLSIYISHNRSTQLGADLLHVAIVWSIEEQHALDLHDIELQGVYLPVIDLDALSISGVSIRDSIVQKIIIGSFVGDSRISIAASTIASMVGVSSRESVPVEVSLSGNVNVSEYDGARTNDSIVSLSIDPRVKALLTALVKLFRQRGSGRVIGAFRRGLPPDVVEYVEAVLSLLVKEGLASRVRDVYYPTRKYARRVNRIIDSPGVSDDPLIAAAMRL